ncbi:HdeD family acid-resistance protein [Nocardioides taihuensis]|uniref:HdeD family acid-resistance protein n=1 Tax=Nocardioides taihuensis TaxID=1835606 RepID=A0ABW0BFG1_9ACTN
MVRDWMTMSWKGLLLRGAIAVVFGIVAIAAPVAAALAFALLWGIWALADGIGAFVQAFSKDVVGMNADGTAVMGGRSGGEKALLIVLGLIGVVAGLLAITSPGLAAVALTWILGIWLIVRGIFELVGAFSASAAGARGLLILGAVVDFLLGILFVANPGKSVVGIAVFLGILAIIWGIVMFVIAFMIRKQANAAPAAV